MRRAYRSGRVWGGEDQTVDSTMTFPLDLTDLGWFLLPLFKGKPVVQKIIGQILYKKEHETQDFVFNS